MPRHRKPKPPAQPAAGLVICTEAFHHGEEGYVGRGHHLVGEIRHIPDADGPGRLEWTGHGPESGPLRTPGITIAADLRHGSPPIKRYRHGDAPPPWRFRCSCGLDRQKSEADLAVIAAAWMREFPGRPVEYDMRRL